MTWIMRVVCMVMCRESGSCDCEQETIVKWIQGFSQESSVQCSQEGGTLVALLDLRGLV